MARVWQKDKDKRGVSQRAREAYWIEIEDCDHQRIVKKIGDFDLANRILNKYKVMRDEGRLFKRRLEMTINELIDEYFAAKKGCIAAPASLLREMNYLKKKFGQFKVYELTPQLFRKIRKELTKTI